jgi:hypothetical protein
MGKSWKGLVDERAQADHSMELPDRRELGRGESR